MFVFKAAIKIIIDKWVRIFLFIAATAVLTFSFGTLGRSMLYGDSLTDPLSVVIVDQDDSMESRMFTQMFQDYEAYADILRFSVDQEEAALSKIKVNEAAAVLILPENFAENIKSGSNEPFIVVLNEAQPLKKMLVEYFAEAFAGILAGSQSGVYADLDFTYQYYPDSYNSMFTLSNLKFLNIVLNRQDMLKASTVSAVSGVPVFLHFVITFWIFLNIAGAALFFDLINSNFNSFMLKKLYLTGTNVFLVVIELILALFLAFLLINTLLFFPAFLFFPMPELSFMWIACVMAVLFCISCFTVFISLMIKNSSVACVMTAVFSLAGLFLSGGVIPRDFFTPEFKNFSYVTLNFWFYESVTGAFAGEVNSMATLIVLLFCFAFFLLSVLRIFIKTLRSNF